MTKTLEALHSTYMDFELNKFFHIIGNRSLFFWVGVIVLAGFVVLATSVDLEAGSIAHWFEVVAKSPFAIPASFIIYTGLAFVSAPQWMLHGASVLAFGPVQGALVAWCATMVSASFDFWLGRRLGAERVEKLTGGLVKKLIDIVQRHGFWTSLIVRIVPTGPFIVVNMAAGVTRMKFWAFFVGTAIGIIPKIITIAFFGEGIQSAVVGRGPIYVGVVIAIALLWIGIMYFARAKLKAKSLHMDGDVSANPTDASHDAPHKE